jgi:hypothetical protein
MKGMTMKLTPDSLFETRMASVVSRRAALRGLGGAGAATALALSSRGRTGVAQMETDQIEPGAGAWRTWLLTSGDQFRPAAPPDEAATEAELDELDALAAERDAAALDQITNWNAGAPALEFGPFETVFRVPSLRTY